MRSFLICLSLVLVTATVYAQVYRFEFVHFDDQDFVYANSHITGGLTRSNMLWAITSHDVGNYIPLTRLSWMASVSIFGLNAGAMHIENVCLHLISTILVFFLLKNAFGNIWRSAFVAFVFAMHPTHTESVVWISERKDVLSTVFVLAGMLFYVRWTKAWTRAKSVANYAGLVVCFTLGMLSKQMLVTMPFVLILLDYWPLGRGRRGLLKLVLEKAPLFLITIAAVLTSYFAAADLLASTTQVSIGLRLENAFVSYARYLMDAFWPVELSPFYPWQKSWGVLIAMGSPVLLLLISVICLWFRRTRPYLLMGWLWFLGVLVPSIGLVQVGPQSIADRWLYLPLIGLTIMATWAMAEWMATRGPGARRAVIAATVLLMMTLSLATYRQIGYWRDTRTLFSHALMSINAAPAAHMQIARLALLDGDKETAFTQYTLAIQLAPEDFQPEFNLGNLLLDKPEQAILHYQRALALEPHHARIENNLAIALLRTGRPDLAFEMLQSAIADDPQYADPHANLGLLMNSAGKLEAAEAEFNAALRIDPQNPIAIAGIRALKNPR